MEHIGFPGQHQRIAQDRMSVKALWRTLLRRFERVIHAAVLRQLQQRHPCGWNQFDLVGTVLLKGLLGSDPHMVMDLATVDEHLTVRGSSDEEPRGESTPRTTALHR